MTNLKSELQSSPIPLRSKKKKKKLIIGMSVVVIIGIVAWMNKESIYREVAIRSQNVPGLNQIFDVSDDPYAGFTTDELIKKIEVLNLEVERLGEVVKVSNKEKEGLLSTIEGLKTYEETYDAFTEQKEKWDKEIAKSNPELFIEQYELMYPEYAAEIYKEVIKVKVLSSKQKEYARMIGEMEEEQAAKALEKIVSTDSELIKLIFEGMPSERRSLILSNMSSQVAAQTIKLLVPELDEEAP